MSTLIDLERYLILSASEAQARDSFVHLYSFVARKYSYQQRQKELKMTRKCNPVGGHLIIQSALQSDHQSVCNPVHQPSCSAQHSLGAQKCQFQISTISALSDSMILKVLCRVQITSSTNDHSGFIRKKRLCRFIASGFLIHVVLGFCLFVCSVTTWVLLFDYGNYLVIPNDRR